MRLSSTLDQLLTLARVEGRVRFDDGEASRVADVAEHALADSQHNKSARFVVSPHWPDVALAMPRELAITALRNLLDNAINHGPADAPVNFDAQWEPGERHLTFSVSDQGPGVDGATLEQLTQRFWRASKQQGSGLGLAIVAAIAERFGGEVTFVSPAGGGFTARLVVPVAGS
ncbi:Sensor protein CreC [Vreelandella titanicae]